MATATTTQPTFAEASAREMPTLSCIGKVVSVSEPKETQKNDKGINYIQYDIALEGYGASRNMVVRMRVRPEWFTPGFKPGSFKEIDGGTGLEFFYGKNIAQKGSISTLQGLVGARNAQEEGFALFAAALFATEGDPVKLGEALSNYLIEEGNGSLVGYVLKQQQEKAGVDEETGKNVYTKTQFYEVGNWFVPDEKGRKSQYTRAEKSEDGSFRVSFTEDDVPF